MHGTHRPAEQPHHRQRQARYVFAKKRFKTRRIMAVELVEHPQLLLMRQPGAIISIPRHTGLGVYFLRIVERIGMARNPQIGKVKPR